MFDFISKRDKKAKVQKTIMIEKEVEVEVKVPILKNSCITIISNATTGKSFLTWNMAHCFSQNEYLTTVINLDRGYSANSYFGIDESLDSALEGIEEEKDFKSVFEKAYLVEPNLRVVTNKICSDKEVPKDNILKLISSSGASSDVTIIDTKSKVDETLKMIINYSNIVIIVFDLDYMHYKLNLQMLEELKEDLNLDKTIAVINNTFDGCKEKDKIYKFIKELKFKDIITVRNAGSEAYDTIYTQTCPYFTLEDKNFKDDIDTLMETLSAKSNEPKSFYKKMKNAF
ncbi:MAG: hypothetical protein RR835_02735 [Peptostreptococcaceae bacterium]